MLWVGHLHLVPIFDEVNLNGDIDVLVTILTIVNVS